MGIFDIFKKSESEPEPEQTEPEQPQIEPEILLAPVALEPEQPQPKEQKMSEVSQPPTSSELPPGHPGEPTAAASSSTDIGAEQKTTEAVVPVFDPNKVEQLPKSYIDTQVEVTDKAEQLTEDRGEKATEEVKAAEQVQTFESKLEKGAE